MLHTNSPEVPNKSTVHLTDMQLKYLAARAEGKSRGEAVRAANYTGAPAQIERSDNLRKALILAFEAKGLTTGKLAQKIADKVDAKKQVFFSKDGIVCDEREVDDNETQAKFTRTALEVRGDLVKEEGTKMQLNVGIIEMPGKVKDVEAWNEDVGTQK